MRRYGANFDPEAARAVDRQLREERRFLEERAAPGEDLGWGDATGSRGTPRMRAAPERWQPRATPTAGDLMTENPAAVTPDTPLSEAARTMRDLDVGILPVVDGAGSRRLLGVVTDRDITVRAVAEGRDGASLVEQCMTRGVEPCHPDDRVRDVLHVMERERVRRVPVVDHSGALVGIIAQADLAVDFAAGEEHRELRVENAIERISEPARPRRRGGGRRGPRFE
jgi:CBS domain-containing protein